MLKVGSPTPEFSVVDTEKQKITHEQLKGQPALILFFPFAFTSVCTAELCSVRDDIARYDALNVRVIGVSTDSPFTLAKFKSDQGLNFTLASDYNKGMIEAFGAKYEEFGPGLKGVARRAAFVLDAEGMIRYAEVLESAGDLPDFNAIRAVLDALKQTA
ncbi:MAG: peroxiredoxin [Bacteroidia bacterium]